MKKYLLLTLLSVIILLSGCDNIIGLGDKVDLDPPEISLGSYEDGKAIVSGDYVRGTITLRGSASDDTGIESVALSVDGGSSWIDASVSDVKNWSCSIDTTDYEDGEKEIIILVTDIAPTPRTDETRLLLYFDNTPPVVMVKNPTGFRTTSFTDADLSIKGEASDPFRVREIRVNLVGGSGTVGDVSGTNTWSCIFESTGTGSYIFEIEAEDYAGNISSHFYHYDDILSANDNNYITPEEVYLVENGQDSTELTGAELTAAELSDMTLSISLDLDNPVIVISNPDPDALVFENILAGNAKFIGSVSDDDGVDTSTLEISLDGGSWKSVDTVNGSGLFVTWEHTEVYGASADHTLQIRVDDIYGVSSESQIVNYRINTDAALVDITSPAMSEYIDSSNFTISGLADDTGGGVTNIDVSLDNGSTWLAVTPATALPQETVNWTYNAVSVEDGLVAIKVRASDDNGGTWTYTNTQITVDTSAPLCDYTSPRNGSYVNGDVTLYGTCSDNNLLESVEIKIGDNGARPWISIPADSLYNWTYTFDSSEYENGTDSTESPGSSGNYLVNLYIKSTDKAGNVTETTAGDNILFINNALDKPIVSIIAPQEDVSLGGSAIVSGTSSDDDGEVFGVYMQIDVTTASGDTPDFSDTLTFVHGIDFDGSEGKPPVTLLNESAAYLVEGKAPWSVILNENGELYNTDAYHDGVPDGHEGDVYIRVWAADKGGETDVDSVTGDMATLHFRFDNSIPQITNMGPASESYVHGTFNIVADVTDESQIKHLEISYDGGTTYHYLIQDSIDLLGYGGWTTANREYAAVIPIDTSDIPDVGNVTSDDISIRLKVTDDTNYQSQETLIYYVDNNLPSGWMSQDTSDIYGTGDTALLYGYADDLGGVKGVEKIILYFEKDGLFYNPCYEVTFVKVNYRFIL